VGRKVVESGLNWLRVKTANGTAFSPTPIGFYFASLWYFEELYLLVFTVAALHRVRTKEGLRDLDRFGRL
jgi:squalene-hopene/tetraprenyl-beta-curcumene cyclase